MEAKFISALAVLGMAMFSVPASASAAKADIGPCQRAAFFGAHGVNEGAAGTTTGTDHWGTAVELVFKQLQWSLDAAHEPLPEAESVSYPRVTIDPKSWQQDFQAATAWVVANYGSGQLVKQLKAEHEACPDQAFVISGYSQGAWVVDKALHTLHSTSRAEDLAILHQIKYVFVMGDPAFPAEPSEPNGGEGIATRYDHGYSWDDYYANGLPRGVFVSMSFKADPICDNTGGSDINDTSLEVHASGYFTTPVICDTGGGDLDNLTYPVARCGGSTMAAMPYMA